MKNVIFKKIYVKNFLSIGNQPIELDFSSGINIITGWNFDTNDGNACGKTSLISAIFFCLFGKSLNNIKQEELINDQSQKDCVVKLNLEIDSNGTKNDVILERGLSPNFCKIVVNGDHRDISTIPATNEYIVKLISATDKVFKNTIIHRINKSVPFMTQSKQERREFIESILRLEVFRIMSKLANEEHKDLIKTQEFNIEKENDIQKLIKIYYENVENYNNNKSEKISILKNRKDEYSTEIRNIKIINNINEIKENYNLNKSTFDENIKKINKIMDELYNNNILKAKYETEKNIINQNIIKINENLKNHESKIEKTFERLENKVQISSKINKIKKELEKLEIDKNDNNLFIVSQKFIIEDVNEKLENSQNKYNEYQNKVKEFDNLLLEKYYKFEDLLNDIEDNPCLLNSEIIKEKIDLNKSDALKKDYEIKDLENKINNIKQFGGVCDKCNRPFSDSDKTKNDNDIKNYTDKIILLKEALKKLNEEIQINKKLLVKCEIFLRMLELKIEIDKNIKIIKDTNKIVNKKTKDNEEIENKIKCLIKEQKNLEINLEIVECNSELLKNSKELCKITKEFEKCIIKNEKIKKEKEEITIKNFNIEKIINELNEEIKLYEQNIINKEKIGKIIKDIDNDLLKIEKESNNFVQLLKNSENDYNNLKNEIESIKQDINIYDIIKKLCSDEGIKAHIIKKLLKIFNERIEYYLNKLNSSSKIKFNEYFEDTVVGPRNIIHSFDSRSDGEQRRIDLAILFAFMDIRRIQGDVSYNLSCFDELLDSSISKECSDLVYNILRERVQKYNESVFIITHRKENLTNDVNRIINLEKRNGITKIG